MISKCTTGWPISSPFVARTPLEVLDDALGVADRLAADDEQRDVALAGERGDLRAVAGAHRRADDLVLDAMATQLAGHAPAGAQPVGRRAATVERGHLGVELS